MADRIAPDLVPLAVQIDRLHSLPGNPRRGDVEAVQRSLERFGQRKPVTAQRDGTVTAGNHTLLAAQGLGWDTLAVVWTDDDDVVARAWAVADNRTSDLATNDDADLLAILQSVQSADLDLLGATSYTEADIRLLVESATPLPDPIGDPDDVPEPPAVPVSKRGDLWLLGDHRLACGDSTDAAVVGAVLNGESPTVLLTDPPYSSGGRQEGTSRHSTSIGTRSDERISRDNLTVRGYMALMGSVLGSVSAETAYVFTDWRMWSWTFDVLESSGYPVRNMIVWDKKQMGMGFPWRSQHELVAFAKRSAATLTDGKCGNVLQCSRVPNELHPTQKPVDLLRQLLANSPSGDVVDPFGGSGTTLIAAHEEGRRCRLVEVDEAFCDVICARFERTFGIVPVLESTGVAHSFVDAVA